MRSFKAPALPVPPLTTEYDRAYIEQLVKVQQLYFTQLDSEIPIHTQGLVLKNLPESTTGLPSFSLFRQGRDVKILLPEDAYATGNSGSAEVGSVTVQTP